MESYTAVETNSLEPHVTTWPNLKTLVQRKTKNVTELYEREGGIDGKLNTK